MQLVYMCMAQKCIHYSDINLNHNNMIIISKHTNIIYFWKTCLFISFWPIKICTKSKQKCLIQKKMEEKRRFQSKNNNKKKYIRIRNRYTFSIECNLLCTIQYLLLMFHPLLKYIRFCKSANIFPIFIPISPSNTLSILCVVYTFDYL